MAENNTVQVEIELIDKLSSDLLKIRNNIEKNSTAMAQSAKKAENGFVSLGKELKGNFAGSLNAIAGQMVAFASVTALGTFFVKAIKGAEDAAKANAKLTQALGFTSVALQEQSKALMFKVNIDDDEITAMQATLANYVKNEEQLKKLTPAVLDLAKATGQDLNTAALQVGRSIADDAGELGRYKITLDGVSGSSQRVDSAIKGLNTAFGGQAEAIAESSSGIDVIKLSFDQFAESVGEGLLPYLKEFSAWLVSDGMTGITEMSKVLFDITKAIADSTQALGAWAAGGAKAFNAEFMAKQAIKAITNETTDKLQQQVKIENLLINAYEEEVQKRAKVNELEKFGVDFAQKIYGGKYKEAIKDLDAVILQTQIYQTALESVQKVESRTKGNITSGKPKVVKGEKKSAIAILGLDDREQQAQDDISVRADKLKQAQDYLKDLFQVNKDQYQKERDALNEQLLFIKDQNLIANEEKIKAAEAVSERIKQIDKDEAENKKRLSDALEQKEKQKHKDELDRKLEILSASVNLFSAIGDANKRTAKERKALAIAEAIMYGALGVVKASPNIPLQIITAATTAAQVAKISNTKFASGGLPSGRNIPVIVNESGQEAILNSKATMNLGREKINALNSGANIGSNVSIAGDNIVINGNADQTTVKALRESKQQQLIGLRKMLIELKATGQLVI